MHRSRRIALAAAGVLSVLALPSGALAAGGHGAPDLQCQSTTPVYTGTYDNVNVPPGQTCNLSGATIYGNVTVQTTGSVDFTGSGTVGGNLLVGSQGTAYEDTGWTIGGTAFGNGAGSLSIAGTVHGIVANKTETLSLSSAQVDGGVLSNQGVFGGVIGSSVITGSVVINGTTGGSGIPATWFIAGPQLDGSPQDIGGNLVFTGNQGPAYIYDNHIHQNLVCEGNTPPPFDSVGGFGNTVDGHSVGQCATTNPA